MRLSGAVAALRKSVTCNAEVSLDGRYRRGPANGYPILAIRNTAHAALRKGRESRLEVRKDTTALAGEEKRKPPVKSDNKAAVKGVARKIGGNA